MTIDKKYQWYQDKILRIPYGEAKKFKVKALDIKMQQWFIKNKYDDNTITRMLYVENLSQQSTAIWFFSGSMTKLKAFIKDHPCENKCEKCGNNFVINVSDRRNYARLNICPDCRNSYYKEYINSEEWHDIRQERLVKDHFRCQICGSKENLEVHHITYKNFRHEPLEDLVTLCHRCHYEMHEGSSIEY